MPLLPAGSLLLPCTRQWGPFELQRRALSLVALLLEQREEHSLAALCSARWTRATGGGLGGGGEGRAGGEGGGLAQRLLALAHVAVEESAAWEAVAVAAAAGSGFSGSSRGLGGGGTNPRPVSCSGGGGGGQRAPCFTAWEWLGQRARVAQEALLLLKALLLGAEKMREFRGGGGSAGDGCREDA